MPANDPTAVVVAMSPKLRQVLELLLLGRSEKEVANEMGISHHTVHTQVKRLYRALGVNSRAEMLVLLLSQRDSTELLQATGVGDRRLRTSTHSPNDADGQTTA